MYFLQMAYEVCHVSGCICVSGPARGRGGRLRGAETREGPNVRLPERDEGSRHGEAPPRGHDKQTAPPVCDGLVIIHTGGVCSVMPSDSPHMSVCVDQPLAADRNEPVGWRGGQKQSPSSIIFT